MPEDQLLVQPRPFDRCTFRRPFAPNFHECPAFEAVEYGVTNATGVPLASVITCAHLEVGRLDPVLRNGSAYARCVLGGPAERQAYAVAHLPPPPGGD